MLFKLSFGRWSMEATRWFVWERLYWRWRWTPLCVGRIRKYRGALLAEVAGSAVNDFLAYLTTRDEPLILSAHHDAGAAVAVFAEWLKSKGMDSYLYLPNWEEYISLPAAVKRGGSPVGREQDLKQR